MHIKKLDKVPEQMGHELVEDTKRFVTGIYTFASVDFTPDGMIIGCWMEGLCVGKKVRSKKSFLTLKDLKDEKDRLIFKSMQSVQAQNSLFNELLETLCHEYFLNKPRLQSNWPNPDPAPEFKFVVEFDRKSEIILEALLFFRGHREDMTIPNDELLALIDEYVERKNNGT